MIEQPGHILFTEKQIRQRVTEIGEEISRDYTGRDLLLVAILRGAAVFVSDLLRAISIPVKVDYMAISHYSGKTTPSGVVKILKDLEEPVEGRDILVVEDIVDTGLTLGYLLRNLQAREPASLKVCALLDRPARRIVDLPLAYRGFEIPDKFVVGYGLDYEQRYRNLPHICLLKE